MPMPSSPFIVAIIVAYHPNLAHLKQLIELTSAQVGSVIIVDNSPSPSDALSGLGASAKIRHVTLSENMGIAHAQNIGIEFAVEQKADYVLLLDQDSIPEDRMVENLLLGIVHSQKSLPNIIAASPQYYDPRTNFHSLFMVSKFKIPFRYRPETKILPSNAVFASFLISSGTLIDLHKLIELRGMRSEYFIDHVDTEWCLRALAKGYQLLGIHDAKMIHSLGDKVKKFWFFGMRNISEHTPLRDYYMFRNTLLMLKDVGMSFTWRVFLLFRLVEFFVFFLIFSKERSLRFQLMILGLRHGYSDIRGRLDLKTLKCDPIARTSLDPT
jgi:rhamnosyltransferase